MATKFSYGPPKISKQSSIWRPSKIGRKNKYNAEIQLVNFIFGRVCVNTKLKGLITRLKILLISVSENKQDVGIRK